jgi:osmotically-inducible protein OsmY
VNDKQLRQHVIDELDFEPSIDSADIGVVAEDSVVTLSGHVPTYAQKLTAERAAWRVKGVRAVAQNIKVQRSGDPESDEEIAKRALGLLRWDSTVPKDALRVTVSNGWLTLHGEVHWQFQRINAEKDLRNLHGLTGITNNLTLKPVARLSEVQRHIEDALKRNAEVEARKITVQVEPDGEVRLEGTVDTWRERHSIERAAWSVPGVRAVDDRITIG